MIIIHAYRLIYNERANHTVLFSPKPNRPPKPSSRPDPMTTHERNETMNNVARRRRRRRHPSPKAIRYLFSFSFRFIFSSHFHEEDHRVARDAAVLTQRVHLLVRLSLDVHHLFGASQKLREVRLDGGLVRADLRPLRDDGAVDVTNFVPGSEGLLGIVRA